MNTHPITLNEIEQTQNQWAEELMDIGKLYEQGLDYHNATEALIDRLYAYNLDDGVVLFKPTKASEVPFRDTREGAISYFIGDNTNYSEDHGFALNAWKAIAFENHRHYSEGRLAMVMGEYIFTAPNHEETKVEFTFGYIRDDLGNLRIVLHHSSLPYNP